GRAGDGRSRRQARAQRRQARDAAGVQPARTRYLEQGRSAEVLGRSLSRPFACAWRLSLYGLRRGEVLGLRWSDIDLAANTLTVGQARVLVEYKVRIEEPKSRNGHRTLPLDDALAEALTALRKRQLADSSAAGTVYQDGLTSLAWYRGGEYL